MEINSFGNLKIGTTSERGQSSKVQGAEKTAKSAMTDGFVERIRTYAKEDAKRGEYMSAGYIQMEQAQMRRYVSPNRSGPKAQVMSAIQAALSEPDPTLQFLERMLDKLSGNCSANIKVGLDGQTAEIRTANGEVIASYNSLGGGWTDIQTKEEHNFFDEATSVYLQAFREARAEIKAAQTSAQSAPSAGATVDFRA